MNDPAEILALRKELLLARSSLYRLKIQGEVQSLRRSLSWAKTGIALARAVPVREVAFSLAVGALGQGRLARLVAIASRTLVVARLANIAVGLLRTPPKGPEATAGQEPARDP